MPEPSLFRHYQIVQDADGNNVELVRDAEQVCVLAFDTQQLEFVHCHVLLGPLADKTAFAKNARKIQRDGHPLLVRLIDFGEDDENPFYITSNVDGETLASYLSREPNIPAWLALLVASRSLEAVIALAERGQALPQRAEDLLRIVQVGQQAIQVLVTDFPNLPGKATLRPITEKFENHAKALLAFLDEHMGTLSPKADAMLPAQDLAKLLVLCLGTAGKTVLNPMRALLAQLQKRQPSQVSDEIASAHKPRALLAPHLASYQEMARTVANKVRIQSQRLDLANPYSMRGVLSKGGLGVIVEQIPPARLVGDNVRKALTKAYQANQKKGSPSLIDIVLMHEQEDVGCTAEELAEGVSLVDLIEKRGALNLQESSLVLAGLDAALSQLETSRPEMRKLRLDDIFLLTGFPREDSRSTKLLQRKLNEWQSLAIILRGHPSLSSMAGRGLDPSVLLPSPVNEKYQPPTPWQGAWLAAVGRFLLGLDPIPGVSAIMQATVSREREAIIRLLKDEITRAHEGHWSKRADFLARYARLIPRPEPAAKAAKDATAPSQEKKSETKPVTRTKTIPVTRPANPAPSTETGAPATLTAGGTFTSDMEKPTVGFAEVLFRGSVETEDQGLGDWIKSAADAPPTIHPDEVLLPPKGYVPLWLRAAVFIGGSLLLGAAWAHFSGYALWPRKQSQPQTSTPTSITIPVPDPESKRESAPVTSRPKAEPAPAVPKAPVTSKASQKESTIVTPKDLIKEPQGSPQLPLEPSVPEKERERGDLLKPPSSLRGLLIEPSGTPGPK